MIQYQRLVVVFLACSVFFITTFANAESANINKTVVKGSPINQTIKQKSIIGSLEAISILPYALQFNAKVDTGAKNSSMHATDIVFYSQGKQEYVRFKTTDSNNKSTTIELPLLRKARIKRHGGESMSRAVVMIGVCLGSSYKVVQVTLVDRSRFKFPFLIGVSFLKDDFLIDVSQKFISKANCNSVTGTQ